MSYYLQHTDINHHVYRYDFINSVYSDNLTSNFYNLDLSQSRIQRNYKNNTFLRSTLSFIESHIFEKIQIKDLEQVSGVSGKTLTRLFLQEFNLTPMNYIKDYRLKNIHRDLLNSAEKLSITEIALKWGISHLGRLSSEYKDYFGEKPSQTIKRLN